MKDKELEKQIERLIALYLAANDEYVKLIINGMAVEYPTQGGDHPAFGDPKRQCARELPRLSVRVCQAFRQPLQQPLSCRMAHPQQSPAGGGETLGCG